MASSTSATSSSGSSGSASFTPGSESARSDVEKLKVLQDLANNAIAVKVATDLVVALTNGINQIYFRKLNEKFIGKREVDKKGVEDCAKSTAEEVRSTYKPQFRAFEAQYGITVYDLLQFVNEVNEKKDPETKSSSSSTPPTS